MAENKRQRTRSRGLRSRAWWLLRKHKKMTIHDIQLSACTGNEKNAETNLRTWLNQLVRAGILIRKIIDDGKLTSNGTYLYVLHNDLGHQSPIMRENAVFDPNSGNEFPLNQALVKEVVND